MVRQGVAIVVGMSVFAGLYAAPPTAESSWAEPPAPPQQVDWQPLALETVGAFAVAPVEAAGATEAAGQQVPMTRPGARYVDGLVKRGPRHAASAADPISFRQMLAASGPGWAAGDGTISVPLRDGGTLWLFGDTILRLPEARGTFRPGADFVRNSAVLHRGSTVTTLVTGNRTDARSFLAPPEAGHWYWPGHGVAQGDHVFVYMHRMRETAGTTGWNFESVGTDLLRLDARTLAVGARRRLPGGDVKWGVSVVEDGPWTYVYGMESKSGPFDRWARVSRVPTGHVGGEPEYWTGRRWSPDPRRAARIVAGVSDAYSVRRTPGGRWALITQELFFGRGIQVAVADSPTGPFSQLRRIDPGPDVPPGHITYNAMVHPRFDAAGRMLVSWNINRDDGHLPPMHQLDSYRPRFAAVDLGRLR